MNNQKAVFILSDNRDFIEGLSSLVTQELGIICHVIESKSQIPAENTAILVTNVSLADEYNIPVIKISLPIHLQELLSDIKNKFANIESSDPLNIGDGLQLSIKYKTLIHQPSGDSVDLTDKESQLLQIIAESGNAGISREILLKEVWKMDSVLDTHTLETHIYRLRKKIKDAFGYEMIKTNENGYSL